MYEVTTEEAQQLRDQNFIPVLVEDLTDGMRIAFLWRMSLREARAKGLDYADSSREELRYGTVCDLRRETVLAGGYDEDDPVRDHMLVRCFIVFDDGTQEEFTRGRGHHVWVQVSP